MRFPFRCSFRGLLCFYILHVLSQGPTYGYDLIKRIENLTGFWGPSPGSIYPALKTLKERGLVKIRKEKKRIYYEITKKGRNILKDFHESKSQLIEKLEKILESLKVK